MLHSYTSRNVSRNDPLTQRRSALDLLAREKSINPQFKRVIEMTKLICGTLHCGDDKLLSLVQMCF